jgi:dihydroorotase
MELILPRWYDLHAHFRQGGVMASLIADHLKMGCAGILAMPNTSPPAAKVFKKDPLPCASVEEYRAALADAGGDEFDDIIVPLYLSHDTTPTMIEKGAKDGTLRAAKYYPPHGTTGAGHAAPLSHFIGNGVFAAMERAGVILCIHGEEHGLRPEDYFARGMNAEEIFYRTRMPRLTELFPRLKIVCEHITTQIAAEFVINSGSNVAATITPQHLLYTAGHLLQGLKYHLYCLPLVKFEEDREALRHAVTDRGNTKFFAGTDSAPHVKKTTPCGCAAGCYTGGIAPQLYAQAFEEVGADLKTPEAQDAFKRFLCLNGPAFYGLKVPKKTFTLVRKPQAVSKTGDIVPLPLGMAADMEKPVTIPWSIISP